MEIMALAHYLLIKKMRLFFRPFLSLEKENQKLISAVSASSVDQRAQLNYPEELVQEFDPMIFLNQFFFVAGYIEFQDCGFRFV
jgi:adenine-specific DNA methylase